MTPPPESILCSVLGSPLLRRVGLSLPGTVLTAMLVACASLGGLSHDADGGSADASHDAPAVDAHGAPDVRGDRAAADAKGADASKPLPSGAAVAVASSLAVPSWCVVTAGGSVDCWGRNDFGDLGDGTTAPSPTPVQVKNIVGPATSVALGTASGCALTKSGALWCWGYGGDGELGNGDTKLINELPVQPQGMSAGVVSVSAAAGVVCAVKTGGSVWCWGGGAGTALGSGGSTTPTQMTGLSSGVTTVSVGNSTACAVKGGLVFCWGAFDEMGELGNGTTQGSSTPVQVTGLSDVTDVTVGADFVCALTNPGAVMCWGDGSSGALGNGGNGVSPLPVQVMGLDSGVKAIAAGLDSVTALKNDGSVVCWGFSADGELGNGQTSFGVDYFSAVPVPVIGLPKADPPTSIATGAAPCVTTASGSVWCWGVLAELALTPVPVTAFSNATGVTIGGEANGSGFACAVNGNLECWGDNHFGQLANGSDVSSLIPVNNDVLVAGVTQVSAGTGDFACALTAGVVYCWGDNTVGELGNGSASATPSNRPTPVMGLTDVASISAGGVSACALTTAGAVYCWGDNTVGELGNGTASADPSPLPTEVMGLTSGVQAVSVGTQFACAILSDGSVACWGNNQNGQVGSPVTGNLPSPTAVAGITGATAISAGSISTCAIAGMSTVCWGDNTYGELGNVAAPSGPTPVAVTGLSGASQVAVGGQSACAIVGGVASCWGTSYLLGDDSFFGASSPVQVSGLAAGVTELAVGQFSACAVAGGNVRCWGLNFSGQLGNGGPANALTPVEIPGFP